MFREKQIRISLFGVALLCALAFCVTPTFAEEAVAEEVAEEAPLVEMTGVRQLYIDYYNFKEHDLPTIIAQFMADHKLNESNFSMSYELSDGSLRYDFAENVFRTAASTYKLPLNMYYYDLERAGEISPTATIGGYKLDYIHRQSIVYSNNAVSEALYMHLGSFKHYRELMAQYYDQEYPAIYYSRNKINSAYMIAVLKRIYENRDYYTELIGYMKEGDPGEYFKNNDETVEVAHKYGWYDGAVNDVAIVYTETPYYLAAYTQSVPNASLVLGRLSALMTEYTNYHIWEQKEAAAQAAKAEEERLRAEEERRALYAQRVAEHENDMRNVYIRYAICLGIVVLWLVILFVALGVHLFKRRDKKNFMKYMKYYSVPMKD